MAELGSKHLVGAVNLLIRRRRHFLNNAVKLKALGELAERESVELVICTGDYTALGGLMEMKIARQLVEPLTHAPLGFVTLPGNHDVYTPQSVSEKRFEQFFSEFLVSDLPQYSLAGQPFPLVRLIGEHLAVIAINSAITHWQPWRSDGAVSQEQIEHLTAILNEPALSSRFVIFAIHYGLFRADGTPDRSDHGLRNAEALLEVCRNVKHGAIIHGHLHHRFYLPRQHAGVAIFCAGSATHEGREGCWIYDIDGMRCRAWPGYWTPDGYRLGEPLDVQD